MEAKELRIGNYVYNKVQKIPFKITKDNYSVVMRRQIDGEGYYAVELTEQWFLDFGFEKLSKKSAIFNNRIAFQIGKESGRLIWSSNHIFKPLPDGSFIFLTKKEIKHVHELQNLYFALKGEELN